MASSLVIAAKELANKLLGVSRRPSGELALDHAADTAAIVTQLDNSQAIQAACYLVEAIAFLDKPAELLSKNFDKSVAALAIETYHLIELERKLLQADQTSDSSVLAKMQTENVRKMLLAFGHDLRVVLLRLASRLQTLRFYAKQVSAGSSQLPKRLAQETLGIFAPLANRLGLSQIKWELEDLSFRFLEPETYKTIANLLAQKRHDRISKTDSLKNQLQKGLVKEGIEAEVYARPKHIYSIVKKMRGKNLPFERVFDIRAMRVLVASTDQCYRALAYIHNHFTPIVEEFDDYIARPKANGYQSLHTVVRDLADGQPIEIQIRTHAMHEYAEQGVAAHWAYKEAGVKGYSGVQANGEYELKIATLRALLAWKQEVDTSTLKDRIYVFTPQATIIDLPQGATPLGFAYQLHTELGHRCRGATVDGILVPLNTKLENGQTVMITAAKEGGPSRDWLNASLGFLASSRAKGKVRAWFNEKAQDQTIARGRGAVEKLLQREGKVAIKHDELASQLGFNSADALFESVGKEEFSLKTIEEHFKPSPEVVTSDEHLLLKVNNANHKKPVAALNHGVLVVGIDSLLTHFAKCCKPIPPDAISGFVTKGKGVSVHRSQCANFLQLAAREAERVIDVSWQAPQSHKDTKLTYLVDVSVSATERSGLLRDIYEVFAATKLRVVSVRSQVRRQTNDVITHLVFVLAVSDASQLSIVLSSLPKVSGVHSCRRR